MCLDAKCGVPAALEKLRMDFELHFLFMGKKTTIMMGRRTTKMMVFFSLYDLMFLYDFYLNYLRASKEV